MCVLDGSRADRITGRRLFSWESGTIKSGSTCVAGKVAVLFLSFGRDFLLDIGDNKQVLCVGVEGSWIRLIYITSYSCF